MKKQVQIIMNILIPIAAFGIGLFGLNKEESIINYSIIERSISSAKDVNSEKIKKHLLINQSANHTATLGLINSGNKMENEVRIKIRLNTKCLSVFTIPQKKEMPTFIEIEQLKNNSTQINARIGKFNTNRKFEIVINANSNNNIISSVDISSMDGNVVWRKSLSEVEPYSKYDILKIPFLLFVLWVIINIVRFFYIKNKEKQNKRRYNVINIVKKSNEDCDFSQQQKTPKEVKFGKKYIFIINRVDMICVNEGEYYFQMDFTLRAEGRNLFIDSMRINNFTPFTSQSDGIAKSDLYLYRLVKSNGIGYLHQGIKQRLIDKIILDLFKQDTYEVENLELKSDTQLKFTMIDKIMSVRLPDGYDEMPTKEWTLIIKYNSNKEIAIPFLFNIKDYTRLCYH